jgi:exonuclease SbcC
MRPERLIMRGFGVFRQVTEVNFTGVELFALTGPTGSGKTTVLDGICFALYGLVPRHGRRDVAPVVTQGLTEAVVSLEFLVGEQRYTVARHVRKDAKRKTATTDEATLERSGEVVATGADAVTDAVKNLLGLDFDQFTTCVLLPQGEFQRFLHDKPADRQNLLSALLDLGIYERIGQAAGRRQSEAEGRLAQIDHTLATLDAVSPEEEEESRQRVTLLTALLAEVEKIQPDMEKLDIALRKAETEAGEAAAWLDLLAMLAPPFDLDSLSSDRIGLTEETSEAEARVAAAKVALATGEENLTALPSKQQLTQWTEAWTNIHSQVRDQALGAEELVQVKGALEAAGSHLETARLAHQQAGDEHRAAHLRATLVKGHSCPVCEQRVATLPPALSAPEMESALKNLEKAEVSHQTSARAVQAAEMKMSRLEERIQGLHRLVEGSPSEADLPSLLARVDTATIAREDARNHVDQLQKGLEKVYKRREALVDRERQARLSLQTARDRVAALQPPALELEDPAHDWKTLTVWAEVTTVELAEKRAAASSRQSELATDIRTRSEATRTLFETAQIQLGQRPPRDVAVDAVTAASARLHQIEKSRAEATRLQDERKTATATKEVAAMLVKLLRNDAFRNWLLDEVFAALVSGANRSLADLTKGQYSLDMSGRDFEVIDNFNAGNRRSVKTLSGGETFLVSLALALSLADQVAESSMGTAQLDSIFLDEGFGTLDADTLEVVANVINELGASGKMVGIVTHVAELAEQMPKRYEVRKGASTAVIEEVSE